MRSTTAGRRRLSRPTPGARLRELVRLLAMSHVGEDHHLAFHVVDLGDELDLGVLELPEGVHPFAELAGTTSPAEWSAFGLVVQGRARHLDDERSPSPTTFAYGLDRAGHEASAGFLGGEVVDLPGPAVGTIPDLCRRILEQPTAPAPPTSALLWTTQWLHHLHEKWQEPERRGSLSRQWPAIAALHPAVGGELLLEPAALIERARRWTHSHPWDALRRGEPLALPDGPLPVAIADWMDDGFFARWVIGAYPSLPHLVADVVPVIEPEVRSTLVDVLVELLADTPSPPD